VVKADGLAAGKGVFVCLSGGEAEDAVRRIAVDRCFGEAGASVLVEDFLEGEEASILALTDGEEIVTLASSQDHKRVFDEDMGPNTGGMGAYSPAPVVTDDLWPVIRSGVLEPVIGELARRGIRYRGVIYAGLMIGPEGPKVLEFNCRFGDPETQAVIPRIAGDLLPALTACAEGGLSAGMIRWQPDPCVCVVMASGGYPEAYAKGKPIEGLDAAGKLEGVTVFHAGTSLSGGRVVTAGGRVLGVTARGAGLEQAIRRAYEAAGMIVFEGAHFRKDIGRRALVRMGSKAK
jgi:phosphoribosylamine--glycine ligase